MAWLTSEPRRERGKKKVTLGKVATTLFWARWEVLYHSSEHLLV
jgi:hypothetical protein